MYYSVNVFIVVLADACPHEKLIKDPLKTNAALCPTIAVGNKHVISVDDVVSTKANVTTTDARSNTDEQQA